MLNVKNHHVYTDKFALSVVDLNQIELATEEDRQWKIDYWSALFKATTWEETRMLAKKNPILEDAVVTMYEMSAKDAIREQCQAREDYYRTINTFKTQLQQKDQQIEQQSQQLEEKDQRLEEKDATIAELRQQLAALQSNQQD